MKFRYTIQTEDGMKLDYVSRQDYPSMVALLRELNGTMRERFGNAEVTKISRIIKRGERVGQLPGAP